MSKIINVFLKNLKPFKNQDFPCPNMMTLSLIIYYVYLSNVIYNSLARSAPVLVGDVCWGRGGADLRRNTMVLSRGLK